MAWEDTKTRMSKGAKHCTVKFPQILYGRYMLGLFSICIVGLIVKRLILLASISNGNERADVMLLGYLRGGTTFTAEMLSSRKGHFGIVEPFTKLAGSYYYKPGHTCHMFNKIGCKPSHQIGKALGTLRDIYRCNFNKVRRLLQKYQVLKSEDTETGVNLTSCARADKPCEEQLELCAQATSIVTKVARISMSLTPYLLDTLPNLKIVHLLRDPRAIVTSRLKAFAHSRRNVTGTAASLCLAMKSNYLESIRLMSIYPKRIYQVFYEDIALDSVAIFEKLYEFIGYSFNRDDYTTILEKTRSMSQHKYFNFSAYGRNSTMTARKWRTTITVKQLRQINAVCSSVYRLLGYPAIETEEELHDPRIPLKV